MKSNRSALRCVLFAAVLFPCFLRVSAYGQASASGSHPATSERRQTNDSAQPDTLNAQLARQSREAAGEDENAQFKHSPSVEWVAKKTGLSPEGAYWLCFVLNFAVVTGVIFWASRKYLPGVFRNRTASIQKAMEEARKASEEANRRLADIESRLSKLDVEISTMGSAAEQEAAAEEARIKAAAEEDARKIVQSAEQEIAAAVKSARRELTAYAANLAVTLAKKQIHIDVATDEALINYFAQQLPKSNGGKDKR
jgi:F-type H+-transporting ATPase subunit b